MRKEPRSYISDSLSPKFTNNLPDVVHRPQESGGIHFKLTRRVVNDSDRHYEYIHCYDEYESKPEASNLLTVTDLVKQLNHKHSRKSSAARVKAATSEFLNSLEVANLCSKCQLPLKTITGADWYADEIKRRKKSYNGRQFFGVHFHPTTIQPNTVVAYIKPHFSIRFDAASGKYYKVFRDGVLRGNPINIGS